MNKIVLDLKIENLKNNDIIIYDEKQKVWLNLDKNLFLGETNKRIKNLKEENESLKKDIENLKKQVSELATLILEDLR